MRFGPFGLWEMLIILVLVLLLFGARRLPEMARGIGQGIREFRSSIKDVTNEVSGHNVNNATNEGTAEKPASASDVESEKSATQNQSS